MRRKARDAALWDLPRIPGGDDGPAPPDTDLAAYRAGSLHPRQETRLEWRLAGSRRGRARLAELAGIPAAPAPSARRGRAFLLSAALLGVAATLLLALLLVRPVPHSLPAFEVRAEGLARTREGPGGAVALPDGPVRVVVEPAGQAMPDLRFALYRQEEGRLTRLAEPGEVAVAVDRGSAILTARADRLVGREGGTRTFYLVVSDRALPRQVEIEATRSAVAELGRASGGRVYPLALTIVGAMDGVP